MNRKRGGAEFKAPDFGVVLTRQRFLTNDSADPSVVVLSAPAGYGKSVLAAQLASQRALAPPIWIDAAPLLSDRESLLRIASMALESRGQCVDKTLAAKAERHPSAGSREWSIVFDDLKCPDVAALFAVVDALYELTGQNPVVVVTTRDDVPLFSSAQLLVIKADCLRFSDDEAQSVLDLYGHAGWTPDERRQLVTLSGSWAALLVVLARQSRFSSVKRVVEGGVSPDVYAHLRRVAEEQLSADEIRTLCVMCLMKHARHRQLEQVIGRSPRPALKRIGSVVPLVQVEGSGPDLGTFRVHDLARDAFADACFAVKHVPDFSGLVVAACRELDRGGRHEDVLALALEHLDDAGLVSWTLREGHEVLASGGLRLLQGVLERLGPSVLLRSPTLLLLHARLLRETSAYREALRKATVARDIARFQEDQAVLSDALLMIARMQLDLGEMADAVRSLREILDVPDTLTDENRALAESYLGLALAFTGSWTEAQAHSETARSLLDSSKLSADSAASVLTLSAAVLGVISGRWDEVLGMCLRLRVREDMSLALMLQCQGNLGSVLSELGRLARAEAVLHETLARCGEHGLRLLAASFTDSMAVVQAGVGHYTSADELTKIAVDGFRRIGDPLEVARVLTYQAVWSRARGAHSRGLEAAEAALEHAGTLGCEWLTWAAALEVAACLCALGDLSAAAKQAESLRSAALEVGALRHWLTADMILAEVARREGRLDEGIERLAEHEEYILTESANWQIAMYVRSFPHLLGMLALALGPEKLPVHLLRMVLPHDAQNTLGACAEILDDEMWRNLATRVVGETDVEHLERLRNTPLCHVRFFGGFQVRVGEREVLDKHWRKRKARLMFAMLAANQGTEIPREQLYELLWPEMDEPRARNNFYVIWGAMKAALAPEAEKSTPCPYAENTAGVCRVPRDLVTSDIDEFRLALSEAEEAGKAGESVRAIRAYEQLADVYRGEFLPGDIYEDCFADIRDAFRVDFGDAMLRASELLDAEGDRIRALLMVRRGLKADPAREDLYQAAITLQIALGQRSAAIETYSACRKRLAEELGLDPSSDTLKLYEQVLAMEDGAEGEWGSGEESPEPPDGEAS